MSVYDEYYIIVLHEWYIFLPVYVQWGMFYFFIHHFCMTYELNSSIFKERMWKRCYIYKGTYQNPNFLTCDFSAISAWIFMQPAQSEALWKDLSNDT